MTRRLLATGVTGFVGTPCLNDLLRAGFDEIHAVSRQPRTIASGVAWHAADLRDEAQAARLVREVRPTHIFHAAWIATPGLYLMSPENRDWMRATSALARAFAETGGRRFLGVGSAAEYAAGTAPCGEDRTPILPASLYGKAKAESWRAIGAMSDSHGVEAVWARLFIPYGRRSPPQRLIPMTIAKLRADEPVPLVGGDPQFDFVYTCDAARMLIGLLTGAMAGVFNIGSGEARTPRAVVELAADRLGARDRLRFAEMPRRPWEPSFLVADMAKTAALGLMRQTPMAEALDRIIEEDNISAGGRG